MSSAVARVTDECREFMDRDNLRWRDVYEIATRAAALALKEAFDNDAELACLRIERDHYAAAAVNGLMTRPFTMKLPRSDL